MSSAEPLTADLLLRDWTPRRVGRRMVVLDETTSTNSAALNATAESDADGLVVLAEYQSAGRGRQGRTWQSPRGASVLCSVLLLPAADAAHDDRFGGRLTLLTAVAVCDAIRQATDITPAIKWPNDLRVDRRKLGGILIESKPLPAGGRAWVIGVGINCLQHAGHFPPELRDAATSLEMLASHAIDRADVARHLLRALDNALAGDLADERAVHERWLTYAEPIGQRVRVRCSERNAVGRVIAIDPAGGLILQTDAGRQEWFDPALTTLL